MATPSVEDLLQQLIQGQQRTMERIDAIVVQSTNTNTRIDKVLKRVEDIELAQSLAVYPTSAPEATSNPLISNTKSSSPTNSEVDDQDSSIANPVNKEDLAAVLDASTVTPILTKRRSTSDHKDRRDSYFIRQLDANENDTTIKYHNKAPDQPESLKKIKYRDVLQHLEALLDYEHKYRIKLPLARTISQSCMDQIQSRFNISPKQFHSSSLAQILTYLSTICTPSTRQEMITFLTMYSGSLCNVTKVPTASNISYFVHALQDHRRRLVRLLEFISFDPRAVQVMPLDNFKKDPPGLWLIIQNSLPFSWLKNSLDQHDPSRKNIKTTKDLFSYIKVQCKLLKDQEIEAKQTDNMFTGTSADQQRKDASATRDPARPNIHAITESSPQSEEFPYQDY
jgi:hypothetical protein